MKALDLDPILEKKNEGTLTVVDLLDSNDAVTDLKSGQSQLSAV